MHRWGSQHLKGHKNYFISVFLFLFYLINKAVLLLRDVMLCLSLLTSRETPAPPRAGCPLIPLEVPRGGADPRGFGPGSRSLKKAGVCSDSGEELSSGGTTGRVRAAM